MHWCLNAVTERAGHPAAVLIRALEPLEGLTTMRRRRGGSRVADRDLCSGPAKLCQALGVTGRHDGLALTRGRLRIVRERSRQHYTITVTPRIGIKIGRASCRERVGEQEGRGAYVRSPAQKQ